MLPGKMNLAPEQMGLAYRVDVNQNAVVVAWGEAVNVSADAVLELEGAERRSERLEAMEWLRAQLANGPVAQRRIKTDATREGFSYATLRRAKDALGIVTDKSGYQGPSQWRFKNAHSKGAQAHTPEVNTFEQYAENAKLNCNHAAKGAQPFDVSPIDAFEDENEVRL
jgi:hypothetical protein